MQKGDNECVLALLFFKRVNSKSDLILDHVKEKLVAINTSGEVVISNSQGQLKFFYELSLLLEMLKLVCNKLD